MRYLLGFLSLSLSLQANYCIQVMTTNLSEKRSILNEVSKSSYNQFNNLRVEQRGNYYVLRIGDYQRYKDSKQDLYAIRSIKRDAYVRTCTFDPNKSIYSSNNNQYNYTKEPQQKQSSQVQSYTSRDTNKYTAQTNEAPRYKQNTRYSSTPKEESRYNRNKRETSYNRDNRYRPVQQREEPRYNRNDRYRSEEPTYSRDNRYTKKENSLADDCEKCFVPKYRDILFDF